MISLLFIGFLIGMRHALEADHVAAVASLASSQQSLKQALHQGLAWGLGHTLTLFLIGSIVLWMDTVVPTSLAQLLEFLVGVMLVILGGDVLIRVIRERIHFHKHNHGPQVHFHAHSHAAEGAHQNSAHRHQHRIKFPLRFLLVGLMHGMAGSAAVILLTLETIQSPWQGMLYILLFGVGSMLGMGVLSIAIAIPLRSSAKGLTWMHNGLQTVIGIFTVGLGLSIMLGTGLPG
ncbi:MAG: sulfite exporter TauE/SafE family protein [Gammaproteobacteria bacterium]|nr:sulfite exporter TauE/SafE family protein [Gammaproteobacteria bacterium]MBL6998862.1 sulfite exporter TauE/SafE family protein [Gammaproteobacteria bacterium]